MIRDSVQRLQPYSAGESGHGYTKLSSNESPFGISPAAARAVRRALRFAYRYPPADPQMLRAAIGERHQLDARWVTVGNGLDELLNVVCSAVMEPGRAGVVEAHTFSVYRHAIELCGGEVRVISTSTGALDWRSVVKTVDSQTALVFIGNPNNPTGSYLPRGDIERVIAELPPHPLLVLDEAYADFANNADFGIGERFLHHKNVVVARTFSKIYALAGLRVGYLLATPTLTELFNRIRSPFNCNLLAQAAATAVVNDHHRYARARAAILTERERLRVALCDCGFAPLPSQGNFICLPLGKSATSFAGLLKEQGFLVRALDAFGLPHHVRITIGNRAQNRNLIRTLRRLQDSGALGSYILH